MIHLFINAGSASAGGGLTYLRSVVAELLARTDLRATILLSCQAEQVVSSCQCEQESSRLKFIACPWYGSASLRYWREQWELPRLIRSSGADVLLSTGNVALRKSPVPQILLSRNALYTTPEFFRDLRARRAYSLLIREWCKGIVAKRSLHWSDCTVAPSVAFAKELQASSGREIVAVNHGFDSKTFFGSQNISEGLQTTLQAAQGCVRLLFVSHYNYYRNFETLLRAVPFLRQRVAPKKVKLFLTCRLRSDMNHGLYRANSAAALVRDLAIEDEVVQLGTVPYESLHHLYKACDVYVTPAYAESFAHPLIEAMASGLPIVASDLGVHREICRGAAVYAPIFSPSGFSAKIFSVVENPELRRQLSEAGRCRADDFSWADHVDQIIRMAEQLASASLVHVQTAAAVPS